MTSYLFQLLPDSHLNRQDGQGDAGTMEYESVTTLNQHLRVGTEEYLVDRSVISRWIFQEIH